jgi:AraC family transcriptional regulator
MALPGSEATRAEYAARMNRVLDHIQRNLDQPLDLEGLAAVACFSPFHFHRIFHAWTGETLQAHIQRLRLERAALALVFDPRKPVTTIALDAGFGSAGAFARAFRAAFGMTATDWRKRKMCETNGKPGEAERPPDAGSSFLPGSTAPRTEIPMNLDVHVRPLPPLTLAYLRHLGPYQGDFALFRKLFGQLMAWASPRGLLTPDARLMSLLLDNPNLTPKARHRLDVAVTVPEGTRPDGPIGIRCMDGGLYATAQAWVDPRQFAAPWQALVGEWLPRSGYQPDHREAVEIYLNNPDEDPGGRYHLEIALPVKAL